MLRSRVIPCLLLDGAGLVKTRKFSDAVYVGDPLNAVRIYNEKEVDELLLLDIGATRRGQEPNYGMISEVATECFMPLAYGGGVTRLEHIERIFKLGVEKVSLCTRAVEHPQFITQAAEAFGSQSIVVCLDVKSTLLGGYRAATHGGRRVTRSDPVALARRMESCGAGELIVNSIDRDGTMAGYDLRLIRQISDAVRIPVVACGGARNVADLASAVKEGGASAAAAGSMFVFHGKHRAVLISFPTPRELTEALA